MSNSTTNGIAGCLYNVTLPNIDNWRRFAQGSGFGAGSIAEIYANPLIEKKVVLNIMDGLVALMRVAPNRSRITRCITPPFMRAQIRWRSTRLH